MFTRHRCRRLYRSSAADTIQPPPIPVHIGICHAPVDHNLPSVRASKRHSRRTARIPKIENNNRTMPITSQDNLRRSRLHKTRNMYAERLTSMRGTAPDIRIKPQSAVRKPQTAKVRTRIDQFIIALYARITSVRTQKITHHATVTLSTQIEWQPAAHAASLRMQYNTNSALQPIPANNSLCILSCSTPSPPLRAARADSERLETQHTRMQHTHPPHADPCSTSHVDRLSGR